MSLDLLSSATATEPWKEPASFWGGLSHAVRGISGPVATLSLPALRYNALDMVVRAGGVPIRVASKSVRVREFLPDRMKIGVRLSTENPEGWVSPKELKGRVTLANLFGTPAAGRTVRAQVHLTPALPTLHKWKAYRFSDPMRAKESFNDVLSDGTTAMGPDATS